MEQVPEDVKSERLARLQRLLESQWQRFNAAYVGRTVDVLFEKPGRHAGQLNGRSPYLHQVQAEAPASMIGTIAKVKIAQSGPNSLFGELTAPRRVSMQPAALAAEGA
jgi:tRNA-2-methylthio-N6-dimethylallyladenosine synthase